MGLVFPLPFFKVIASMDVTPVPLPQSNDPDSLLADARALLADGKLDQALVYAEAARALYNDTGRVGGEVLACLLLAQIHHRREDLGAAMLYTEEVSTLLTRYPALPPDVQAEAYFGLARLAPDVGWLSQGLHFGQQALHYYEQSRHVGGQLNAILLIGATARQMGRFQMGAAYLEMARSRLALSTPPPWTLAWLRNSEIHNHWYQGDFAEAAAIGQEAIFHADQQQLGKYRVYQRLSRANVLRGWGRYAEAADLYKEADQLLTEIGFELFRSWIDINRAWLDILVDNYAGARQRIFRSLQTTDRGQTASFNVFLAALYSLTARYHDAQELLRQSLNFYQTSGDELSIFALRCHLAYVYLKTGQIERAEEEMALGFGWAAQWNVDYFPHWWHPQIMATVCTHAFVADLQASLAERILVKHLGEQAIPELQQLLTHRNAVTRQRAADVLDLLNVHLLNQITEAADEPIRRLLAELFADGRIQVQKLPTLAELLSTRGDARANPVLLATFGLYLDGTDRRAIADLTARSESTIRNYITLIYDRFGLDNFDGSRRERAQQLRRLAIEAGFIRGNGI